MVADMEEDNVVIFDKVKFNDFKIAYRKANGDTFWFQDNKYYKPYAKYLIEFLETKIGGQNDTHI